MNENKEAQPEAEKSLCGELQEVRHELKEAIAEEHRVENRIEAAEHRIEQIAEELAKESRIKVNGRPRTIEGHVACFAEVVKFAYPTGPTKPNTKFTVTYRNVAQVPAMGELDPGQCVRVKQGCNPMEETSFNVTETVLS
jgi:sRNA-binding protein